MSSESTVCSWKTMTRSKKWFLRKVGAGVTLANSYGPIKKTNASQTPGNIRSVPSEDTCGKYSVNEALMVCLKFCNACVLIAQ